MPKFSQSRSRSRSNGKHQSKEQHDKTQETKLYVSGLQKNVDELELRKLFDKFGKVTDVQIKRKDGFSFAFVTYSSINEANQAIEGMGIGQNINGKEFQVNLAKTKKPIVQDHPGKEDFRPRGCFKCNEQGHFARQCPQAYQPKKRTDPHQSNFNSSYRGKDTSIGNAPKVYYKSPIKSNSGSRSPSREKYTRRRRNNSRSNSSSISPRRDYRRHSRRRRRLISSDSGSPPRRHSIRQVRRSRSPNLGEKRSRSRNGDRRSRFYKHRRTLRSRSRSFS